MDDQANGVGARPGGAERVQESGAAALGRGGRMSRQRKRAAVLRLLRGEDLEMVSRSLGVRGATLSGWREAFLAAGEAALSAKPASGEELESERLKVKLGAALIERDADSDDVARLFRDHVARCSDMMSPAWGVLLAGLFCRGAELWSILCGWFRPGPAQAVAGEIDAVRVVHEPVEDGVGVGRIPEPRRLPPFLTGWCPTSR
jgi:transposase